MSWYNNHRKEWKEIIETVAAGTGRTEQMVEKDTIQSMLLSYMAESDLPFVFKGGTSLSKAYQLIDRFSEDIDLSMSRKITESEKRHAKELIIGASEGVGLQIGNPEEIFSRHSYNRYEILYESLFQGHPLEIIVETSCYQPVYPAEPHKVGSFVGMFCEANGLKLPLPFEAADIVMDVQSVERTFIDKVFAVCDYRLRDMQNRDSRHLYDIAKLVPVVSFSSELKMLICQVRKDRMSSKNNPSAQPEYDISKILQEVMTSRFYESDYKNITQKLLYDDLSYEEAVKNGIAIVAESDIFGVFDSSGLGV